MCSIIISFSPGEYINVVKPILGIVSILTGYVHPILIELLRLIGQIFQLARPGREYFLLLEPVSSILTAIAVHCHLKQWVSIESFLKAYYRVHLMSTRIKSQCQRFILTNNSWGWNIVTHIIIRHLMVGSRLMVGVSIVVLYAWVGLLMLHRLVVNTSTIKTIQSLLYIHF